VSSGTAVEFQIEATGLVQEVWVTYTAEDDQPGNLWYGQWQPFDLTINPAVNQTKWTGTLAVPEGVPTETIRFMVHAAGANGLVTSSGEVFRLPFDEGEGAPTALTVEGPTAGVYAGTATFTATLTNDAGYSLVGETLGFGLGSQKQLRTTNAQGQATATFLLLEKPTNYSQVQVAYPGSADYAASVTSQPFAVSKRATALSLSSTPQVESLEGVTIAATLVDDQDRALREKTVLLVISDATPTVLYSDAQITDFGGVAEFDLSGASLAVGTYQVQAYFADSPLANLGLNDTNYEAASTGSGLEILNAAPTVEVDQSQVRVDEGQTAVNTGTYNDLNGDELTLSASVGIVSATGDGNWSWSFETTDGPDESQMVSINVSDGHLTTTVSFSLTVTNVAPELGPINGPTDPIGLTKAHGAEVTFSAVFTDASSAETHTAVWDFGDGTVTTDTLDVSLRRAEVVHTYQAPGVYTVKLTLSDNDGGSDSETFSYVVVYDPDGGYITGVGWIISPEGAYAADPSLTGKANFGLNSKYAKGANLPSGETQFQFQIADLTFHSDSYEWLVVSGDKAQYKGVGTVNGIGGYKFIVTAFDADLNTSDNAEIDRVRIKIWLEEADGTSIVIYDNGLDADDTDYEATTELGSGNVTIHEGSKGGGNNK
jgi:PKD repeat protein